MYTMLMMNMHTYLEKYFGYKNFRPLQEDIINNILIKKDVFVLMPTGGGKSLCYQLPSIMLPGVTIVISPLISLMKDQVDSLKANGIHAEFLNSSLKKDTQKDIENMLIQNELKLLYVAPERLVQPTFLDLLKNISINFFAIDEAHCISQWGHDFRPEYRELLLLRTTFPQTPIVALTATATERVKQDIVIQLQLKNPLHFQASFNRPNLTYFIYPKLNSLQTVLTYITQHKGESGIIYCQSRKTVENVAKQLQDKGIFALPYHAGLADDVRRKNQEDFIKENADIVVATVAFGMGIDKPNVRFVVHYNLPQSLEHYYQETGRAGRDGLPSECIFLYSIADKFFYERFWADKSPDEKRIAKQQLQTVISYAQSKLCRRMQLLHYFGEEYILPNCETCDNCLTPQNTFDGTVLAQKILSCVYRVDQRFGASHIANILAGSQSKNMVEKKHHLLSTFNIINDYNAYDIKTFIYELVQLGYLTQSDDQYGILQFTEKSKSVLLGKEKVNLTIIEKQPIPELKQKEDILLDSNLFEKLRVLRKRLADEKNVPPYVIFSDKSLKDMSASLPQNTEQFSKIYGVGKEKLKTYASVFLQEIAHYALEKTS